MTPLGAVLQSFFTDYLVTQKGLRLASIRSYRDTLRLFLAFAAKDADRRLTGLALEDLTFERVLGFLRHLEQDRGNQVATRNQRLAGLHSFFDYVAGRMPEMLRVCERVAAVPSKRTPPPETRYLEREEIRVLFDRLPATGRHAVRDQALLLFLYNSGARVQEVADLRVADLDLQPPARVRLHGKGDKWRSCPLWTETVRQLRRLLDQDRSTDAAAPVFTSRGRPLTRFGIYKIVRRHARLIESERRSSPSSRITPHVFRHTAAVHLLEAGVEVNVIRGWLGHADLATTNRYAEITVRSKEAALRACEPALTGPPRRRPWRDDRTLLAWLASL